MQQQEENTTLDYQEIHNPNAIEQIIERHLITTAKCVVEQISNFEAKQLINLYGKKIQSNIHTILQKIQSNYPNKSASFSSIHSS